MTGLSEMAPAIGGLILGVGTYLYALHIRRQYDRGRRKGFPAE